MRSPRMRRLTVSVEVTNTGPYDGEEVVQMYIRKPGSEVLRPIKDLRGFERVFINKGQTRVVTMILGPDELEVYNLDTGDYRVEKGLYEILVGPSSDDSHLIQASLQSGNLCANMHSVSYPKKRTLFVFLGIILLAALFMLPYLGSVNLFDSNEVNYAESSREMILTGDYLNVQIDFQPFPEKPPLFFWLQVISMKIFGINEFAARFPNFICGIVTLMILYSLGKRIYGHRFGLFWVLSFGSAILPFFFFKSGIIDPWFNLLLFSGLPFLYSTCMAKGRGPGC